MPEKKKIGTKTQRKKEKKKGGTSTIRLDLFPWQGLQGMAGGTGKSRMTKEEKNREERQREREREKERGITEKR